MDSVVEKDERGLPIVRATMLVDVVREQSLLAAQALDDGSGRSWRAFASALFGSDQAPRLITFPDARLIDPPTDPANLTYEVVSLSIDEKAGTAREDFLRLFERVGACWLRGEAILSDVDQDGRPLTWSDEQRDAAELPLVLAGLLVRAIGSSQAASDGVYDALIHADHESGDTRTVKDRRRTQLGR